MTSHINVVIRPATPADAEALVGILNPIIEARLYTAFDTPFSVEAERDYLVNFPPRGIWKVAVSGLRERGRVPGDGAVCHLHHGVRSRRDAGNLRGPRQRRQGIAKRLFEATFAAAREKGYEKIFTFVRADNPAALATYLSHGFQVVGTAGQARQAGRGLCRRGHDREVPGRLIGPAEADRQLVAAPGCVPHGRTHADFPMDNRDDEWRTKLTAEQFRVLRKHGTEPPGSSSLNDEKRGRGRSSAPPAGSRCFRQMRNIESGSGWPSFSKTARRAGDRRHHRPQPFHDPHRNPLRENARGISVTCSQMVPAPTGLRYCMNGVAMEFEPKE